MVRGGGLDVVEFKVGTWVVVTVLGTRLAVDWPPRDLDVLLASVADMLAVRFGHYVHRLRDHQDFADWRMNDLDSLAAKLLAVVGVDATDSFRRSEVAEVRSLVTRHFPGVTATVVSRLGTPM